MLVIYNNFIIVSSGMIICLIVSILFLINIFKRFNYEFWSIYLKLWK